MAFATYLKAAAAATCLLAAGPAAAAVIYEQPLFNGPDGGPYSHDPGQLIAAAFEVTADADVTRVSWYGAGLLDEDFGDFRIQFFSEADEEPDEVLASTTGAATRTNTGLVNSYGDRIFRFSMAIPAFHVTTTGHYFFSVADLDRYNFIWSLSDRPCCSVFNMNGYGWTFDEGRPSNAFALHSASAGVPEPATWAVLVLGFMASGAMLRRRRASLAHA
jgi:hypothetical protein